MNKFLIFTFLVFAVSPLRAEELWTLSIASLVHSSPMIFVAQPLDEPEIKQNTNCHKCRFRRFVVHDILRGDDYRISDTVAIDLSAYHFRQWERGPEIVFDSLIVFGYQYQNEETTDTFFRLTMSGIRLFTNDSIFVPIQIENPGGFYFYGGHSVTIESLMSKIHRTIERFEKVMAMRNIQPISAQNQAILEWIQANKTGLKTSDIVYSKDEENNWANLQWEIFQWINGNGIWEDAWKGIMLSYEIDSLSPILTRPPDAENPFNNPAARKFLKDQITSYSGAKFPAIMLLSESLWKWPDLAASISSEEQVEIINMALPLLKDEQLRYSALTLIARAAFPPDYSWQSRRNISVLAKLKKLLKKLEKPEDQYFKNRLTYLITEMEGAVKN